LAIAGTSVQAILVTLLYFLIVVAVVIVAPISVVPIATPVTVLITTLPLRRSCCTGRSDNSKDKRKRHQGAADSVFHVYPLHLPDKMATSMPIKFWESHADF
jgi:hypothetical protein